MRFAGDESLLPAASRARVWNVCVPFFTPRYDFGDVQRAHAPLSSLHSKVEPGSLARKVNRAVAARVRAAGPPEIVV